MRLSLVFVFVVLSNLLSAQKSAYDIIAMNKEVGEVTVTKTVIGPDRYSLKYTFDAEIKVLFIKTTVDYDLKVEYKNDQVINCDMTYIFNGKPFVKSYVWDGKQYNITTNGKQSTLSKKAFYTATNFYFKEPVGQKEVFLEKQNIFEPITNLGNNKYAITVEGDYCTYTYKNGILQEATVDAFVKIKIVRKN